MIKLKVKSQKLKILEGMPRIILKESVRGQSLFELVIAIGISALVIVVLVSLVSSSLQNAAFSKNESLAGTYAQAATEWLRGQRDVNTSDFIIKVTPLLGTTTCFNSLNWGVTGPCGTGDTINDTNGDPTVFVREITFLDKTETKTIIEADVVVSWTDSKGLHEVTNATDFTDWRQR